MEHGEFDEWSRLPTTITLLPEELLFRISSSNLNHVILKKGELLHEIGVLLQPKVNFVFERWYEKGKWIVTKKIDGKLNGREDLRNIGGRMIRSAIEEGFEIIEMPKEIKYTPLSKFILSATLFGSSKHWEEENNISIEDFESQLNIKLPEEYRIFLKEFNGCLLYTSPSPRDQRGSRMPSSA